MTGSNRGAIYEIKDESLALGRDENATIQILDQGVSRKHAEIFRIGEMYFIRDLGSRNGTFVNEEDISEELLRSGDEIRIGNTILTFEDRIVPLEALKKGPKRTSAEQGQVTIKLDFSPADLEDVLAPVEKPQDKEWKDLKVLYKAAKIISLEKDLQRMMKKLVTLACKAVGADQGYIYIKREDAKDFTLIASYEKAHQEVPLISKSIIRRVIRFSRAILSSDATLDSRFQDSSSVMMRQIRSVICAPLVAMEKLNGVFYLSTSKIADTFTSEHLDLVTALALQAGIALQGLVAANKQEKMLLSAVKTLIAAIEMRSPLVAGHSIRVATFSSAIATELKLPRDKNRAVQLAGLLHSAGKIALREDEHDEEDAVEKKLELTEKLLKTMAGLEHIMPIVRHHKERMDGSGKPDGLVGEKIPLLARVLGVADYLDTLLTLGEAPGQELSLMEALLRIKEQTPQRFDPKVVDALHIAHRKGYLFNPEERILK
jgi:HD-GYP domain-containing protein (c-di-GMP phosphodiesterase class II)